jgi:hypothetical protein
MFPRRESRPERTKKVQSFLGDAFKDYIAARTLFLSELPQQAAILASTAIEKTIKASMALHGQQSDGHLKAAHWNAFSNLNPAAARELDRDFLLLNQQAYKLRYTDNLPVDFNLVIPSRDFLAELDFTVLCLFSCFKIDAGGKVLPTPEKTALAAGDPRFTAENHLIVGAKRATFVLAKPQLVYEVRHDPARGLVEVMYWTDREPKRAGFLRAALIPLDPQRGELDLAYFPMKEAGSTR